MNVTIDGIEYTPVKTVPGEVKIVILQRGWVYVGKYSQNKDTMMCELNSAYCIRKWGTTKGLAELKDGPTKDTVLDPAGKVTFHLLTTIAVIDCEDASWKKLIK